MLESVSSGRDIRTIHQTYKYVRYTDNETALHASDICIANVVRAFKDIFPRETILKAVGDAKTPNGVSMAVRKRLPKF